MYEPYTVKNRPTLSPAWPELGGGSNARIEGALGKAALRTELAYFSCLKAQPEK